MRATFLCVTLRAMVISFLNRSRILSSLAYSGRMTFSATGTSSWRSTAL